MGWLSTVNMPSSVYHGQETTKLFRGLQTAKATRTLGPPILNFAGVPNVNGVLPPDTNFDVGPNHIVQTVNLSFAIWDKVGALLLGPVLTNTLWSGFGGGCEFGNDGDPTVNYDPLADKWLISQFDFGNAQCMAISTTPNPLGAYFRYSFPTPGNDYPKTGVMETAYTGTIRNFSGPFNMDAVVWDRRKMCVGDSTAAQLIFWIDEEAEGSDHQPMWAELEF